MRQLGEVLADQACIAAETYKAWLRMRATNSAHYTRNVDECELWHEDESGEYLLGRRTKFELKLACADSDDVADILEAYVSAIRNEKPKGVQGCSVSIAKSAKRSTP